MEVQSEVKSEDCGIPLVLVALRNSEEWSGQSHEESKEEGQEGQKRHK